MLTARRTITIQGAGATIVDGVDSVFDVGPKTRLTLSGLTTQNGNAKSGAGGGVAAINANLSIDGCAISGYTAPRGRSFQSEGEGIANFGHLILENVTVAENSAHTGGGIFNDGHRVRWKNVTIAGNSTINGGGGVFSWPKLGPTLIATGPSYGHPELRPQNFRMSNSIIADNTATDSANDYDGWLYSDRYNLLLDNSGCAINGKASTDIIGADPLLQVLGNNGGTTET